MPAGLIDQEDSVGFGRDSFGDFRHRFMASVLQAGIFGAVCPHEGKGAALIALVTRRDRPLEKSWRCRPDQAPFWR